jgi:hypothetical protein
LFNAIFFRFGLANSLLTKFQCSDVQLRDAGLVAYEKVFAPHHAPDIRKMVRDYISTVPSRSEVLERLNEDGMFFYNFFMIIVLCVCVCVCVCFNSLIY